MHRAVVWLAEVREMLERTLFLDNDDPRIGHIVASLLAPRLEVDLRKRLDERGAKSPRADLMRDLKRVRAVHLEPDGNAYRRHTDLVGSAFEAFAAARHRAQNRRNVVPSPIRRSRLGVSERSASTSIFLDAPDARMV